MVTLIFGSPRPNGLTRVICFKGRSGVKYVRQFRLDSWTAERQHTEKTDHLNPVV
jgi:hypothetical protein